jgi:hypothetical protein
MGIIPHNLDSADVGNPNVPTGRNILYNSFILLIEAWGLITVTSYRLKRLSTTLVIHKNIKILLDII